MLTDTEVQEVRGLLLARGYTGRRLAGELRVSESVVSEAISGMKANKRVQDRVAGLIGKWPWPERQRRNARKAG